MRLILDTLVAVMLLGILAGVVMSNRHESQLTDRRLAAREEVRRFQQQIHLQHALSATTGTADYPRTIDPIWFNGSLPANPYLGPEHPWVEIAPESQKDILHPPERTADAESVAAFWYNPYAGVVRTRVPLGISDARALELYNFINDCSLENLFREF